MTTILAFLFVLGVLVFVHELGHFLVARWYGVRVITFSLGFGPKLLKVQRGATEYCVSVVPLGGYVKLAGESVEDNRTGAPDEFMSKSKWVRFQVYLAGPIMNLLLAVIVTAAVLARGADVPLYESQPAVVGSLSKNSPALAAGVQPGDRIDSVDGKPTPTWDAVGFAVVTKANREIVLGVTRSGQPMEIRITPEGIGRYQLGDIGVLPLLRPSFVEITSGGRAEAAGLKRGDVLIALNGERGLSQPEMYKWLKESGGKPVTFTFERDGQTSDVTITPDLKTGSPLFGVRIISYEFKTVNPDAVTALKMSAKQNWESAVQIGQTLKGLFTRETPVGQLMGPIAIADLSGTAASLGILSLLNLMSMISLNLGLLNLMPIPVMDGGQIAILAVEGLARRDLSIRVKERILMAGAALVVMLMVTVIYNDIARLLR
jgi:regulator of sigma E protease